MLKVTYLLQSELNENKKELTQVNEALTKRLNEEFLKDKTYELYIFDQRSLYREVKKIRNEQSPGVIIHVVSGSDGDRIVDLQHKKYYHDAALGSNNYIVEDTLEFPDWEISREKQMVFNYETRKATKRNEHVITEAYFAPQLNHKFGPGKNIGLPGLVLKVAYIYLGEDNIYSRQTITVQKIEILPDNDAKIFDKNGEVISHKKFNELLEVFNQEMEEMRNSGVDTSD